MCTVGLLLSLWDVRASDRVCFLGQGPPSVCNLNRLLGLFPVPTRRAAVGRQKWFFQVQQSSQVNQSFTARENWTSAMTGGGKLCSASTARKEAGITDKLITKHPACWLTRPAACHAAQAPLQACSQPAGRSIQGCSWLLACSLSPAPAPSSCRQTATQQTDPQQQPAPRATCISPHMQPPCQHT